MLAGVIVGAFANATIMVVLADLGANTVRNALWWMMGSVADANWAQVRWLAVYAAIAGGLLIAWARQVDLLALGEDAAAGLGLDADRAAPRIYVVASKIPQNEYTRDGQYGTAFVFLFTVAAIANNTRDFSPAGRTFNVPFDDRALAGAGWTRTKAKKHFKNTVTTTTTMGAALTTRQTL